MTIEKLIEQLKSYNPKAEITLVANITDIEDDEQDIDCNIIEIWGDLTDEVVTLFIGLQDETD